MTPKSKRKSIHSRMLRPVSRAFGELRCISVVQQCNFSFRIWKSVLTVDPLSSMMHFFLNMWHVFFFILNMLCGFVFIRNGVWLGQGSWRCAHTHRRSLPTCQAGEKAIYKHGRTPIWGMQKTTTLHQNAAQEEQKDQFQQNSSKSYSTHFTQVFGRQNFIKWLYKNVNIHTLLWESVVVSL